jgi:hypothetical protein
VVPYATTYRQNRMALDVNSLKDDVDIDDAVINVAPSSPTMPSSAAPAMDTVAPNGSGFP